jgi:hypothetical protein
MVSGGGIDHFGGGAQGVQDRPGSSAATADHTDIDRVIGSGSRGKNEREPVAYLNALGLLGVLAAYYCVDKCFGGGGLGLSQRDKPWADDFNGAGSPSNQPGSQAAERTMFTMIRSGGAQEQDVCLKIVDVTEQDRSGAAFENMGIGMQVGLSEFFRGGSDVVGNNIVGRSVVLVHPIVLI